MRIVVLSILLKLALIATAHSGDFAYEQVIGFSKDGRYFGFEEYGVQDGSGFPYSNIFIIDLETDTFAPSTPVRLLKKNETASLASVRWEVKSNAKDILRKYKLNHPAVVAYARGLGDFADSSEGLSAPITSRVVLPTNTDPTEGKGDYFDLVLKHIPVPSAGKCPIDTIGFQMEKVDPNGKRRFVHRDEKIFMSRGCPLKYRLSRIYLPAHRSGDFAAALISVFQLGFEGPDRRFVVFPVSLR